MSNTVITSSDLQVKYEKLYKFLMDFLWEFQTVQALANLEISIFKRFPDKDEMQRCLRELKSSIAATYNELTEDDEEEFQKTFEDLEKSIDEFENPGCELYGVEELVDNPDDVEAADNTDIGEDTEEKKKFKLGDITKVTPEDKEEQALQEEAIETLENPFEGGEE